MTDKVFRCPACGGLHVSPADVAECAAFDPNAAPIHYQLGSCGDLNGEHTPDADAVTCPECQRLIIEGPVDDTPGGGPVGSHRA